MCANNKDLLEILLLEDLDNYCQYRMSITEFYNKKYISIRRWYYDGMDEKWCATKEGVTLPYTLSVTSNLFHALSSILSEAETLDKVKTNKPRLTYIRKPDEE